ncbi:MAG TPA: hydrogenase iron-sulfur subunit [Methylomusa anaerophila]|uniref:Methyl-viologen-reducing hydrogenase, delta subunit n=1 Tax=Methylomusa anaerophila TaxID=1930071 RepID=A0A348AFI5_9FIRM|nr:hydrogenase iron-sulfur subunit [Methylomusa anaerophila]BBB89833.1 methyl-viologen-reducing hydrogenase, delta subunit [Methylomusa anaerophila]HML89121.1 hydrogenase iron-sulfur subunit [Methylomusa anaerophila]
MSDVKVVGFVCRMCALVSSDLGPPADANSNVAIETIELPCAGKVDVRLLLEAFEKGVDAVFVAGCPEHECMNVNGSSRAKKRLEHAKTILDQIGIGGERLVMYNVSGTHGPRFAHIARDMAGLITKLGPSPLKARKA